MSLDLALIRSQFPSLNKPAIFFDNPGGTQIARQSLDRINHYLLECNANHEAHLPPASPQIPSWKKPIRRWPISTTPPAPRKSSSATT